MDAKSLDRPLRPSDSLFFKLQLLVAGMLVLVSTAIGLSWFLFAKALVESEVERGILEDVEQAYAPVRQLRAITMGMTAGLIVLSVATLYWLTRRYARPIADITEKALEIASGNLEARIQPSDRTDEIGVLSRALRRMNETLRAHRAELEHRVDERTADLQAANEQLAREIEERKALEQELRRAKQAAEAANAAKGAFLAAMSHEIRTPMNGIVGMAELLATTPLNAIQREYLSMVQDSAESLLSVIGDILDFSRIEAGRLQLEEVAFDLHELVGNTVRAFADRAHAKGLELAARIAPEIPRGRIGDPLRLRQILVNLLGNAIKFTDRGEVVVEIGPAPEQPPEVLHFIVRDTGIGIPPERQSAVFEAFEQGDASWSRRHGGTGLGLTISARLIEMMGGRIWMESKVGKGTTFRFELPLPIAKPEDVPIRRPDKRLEGMRVLVVEDNATTRNILEEILRGWRMRPTSVATANQALGLLREAHLDGSAFELVLLDASMPDADGFAVAEHIISNRELGSPLIMMLSSADRPGDMARCRSAGIDACVLKPIKQSDLLEAIERAMGLSERTLLETETVTHPSRPLRVLVAEDSPVGQKLAFTLLQRFGHDVVLAGNGTEAVSLFEKEHGNFDLVLMDVQMPEMSGLEATQHIRRLERDKGTHVPIIAMTAHAMKGDRDRCIAAGMDDYLAKPIRAAELREVVERHGKGIADRRAAREVETPADRAKSLLPEHGNTIDWSLALSRIDGQIDLLRTMAAECLADAPRRVKLIVRGLAEKDAVAVRRAAHTLKGSAQALAVPGVAEVAAEIERLALQDDLDKAREHLPRLHERVEAMLGELEAFLGRLDEALSAARGAGPTNKGEGSP